MSTQAHTPGALLLAVDLAWSPARFMEHTVHELVVKEALALVGRVLGRAGSKSNKPSLAVDERYVVESLRHHLSYVENWSSQIKLADMPRSRNLADVVVPPRYVEGHQNDRDTAHVGVHSLLVSDQHVVLLGPPGSGKTTTVKLICQHLLHSPSNSERESAYPLVVRLRNIDDEPLVEHLLETIGIGIVFSEPENDGSYWTHSKKARVRERALVEFLNQSRCFLLLDGLDEVSSEGTYRLRSEIQRLTNLLVESRLMLTCRSGALDLAFDNSRTVYMSPFTDDDIEAFSNQWFDNAGMASSFLRTLAASPYSDTTSRPLSLAHLCLLFDRAGELPSPPVVVYQKIIHLLLEGWDRERDIRRLSKYGRFGPERKRQFLASMAYELSRVGSQGSFEHGDLIRAYECIHARYALPLSAREDVLAEIESHTGLIVKAGAHDMEFAHKSIHEYLCADHISRIASLDNELEVVSRLPNEMAIATVLSSSPNEVFAYLAKELLLSIDEESGFRLYWFWSSYVSRLLIEEVGFEPTEELAACFLLLASSVWVRDPREHSRYRAARESAPLRRALVDLGRIPSVRTSLRALESHVDLGGSGHRLIQIWFRPLSRERMFGWMPISVAVERAHLAGWSDE